MKFINKEQFIHAETIKISRHIDPKSISALTNMGSGSRDRYRELIRMRDNYRCQLCMKKWQQGERRLDIHHLDEDITGKLDTKKDLHPSYDLQNQEKCVTLCHGCHTRLHHKILNKMGKGDNSTLTPLNH